MSKISKAFCPIPGRTSHSQPPAYGTLNYLLSTMLELYLFIKGWVGETPSGLQNKRKKLITRLRTIQRSLRRKDFRGQIHRGIIVVIRWSWTNL